MDPTTIVLIELGAVFLGLGLLGRLAARVGMSPVPLYLLGGLIFGHGGLVPLSGIESFGDVASEIGVVLLLLMLGLEYTAKELVTGLRRSWLAGLVDLVLNFVPGAALALILGWGVIGGLVLGGVTYISSSGIVAKVLTDLGRLGNRETPVVLSILVLEDLVMAVYLPILTAALAGVSFWGGFRAVGVALLAVTLVLLLALRYGPQISRLVHSPDQENFLLKLIGAALLVAGLAAALQVSAAVGAFLLGIAISGSTAHSAAKVLAPLRDLFAAMFFVLFGINTDPATIPPVLVLALALALVTSVTKVLTGVWAARRAGIGVPGRIRAGTALIARGEFSIVIAGLAVAGGGASPELAALATAYVMLLAVLGPIATKLAEPVARALTGRPGRSPQRAGHD
ncbi:MAG: cation:proton antiporter [Arthrobacter sp.]|uniref:cation:proton antiporter n=1 Tax=unclassified Arthrobacter TaxID=235627 RepID=UPI00264DD0C3|nr:cation:proton antiporter [Micrococcaceae bacterium]MDN5822808.1 cation:proton antiporter [Micrococcaceae bacterium]MDN5879242.1 cation:proton antiporter [Micrococcaceae bacterium]MDN5887878.1 cation:proton antiporter [Micrococcaceae bacterium]MDN5906217.1 cation:proton antiporter [Micrococcaceae bacterium]